jgi:hypothetical protein
MHLVNPYAADSCDGLNLYRVVVMSENLPGCRRPQVVSEAHRVRSGYAASPMASATSRRYVAGLFPCTRLFAAE